MALAAARRARSAEDTSTTMEPETTATESGAVERRRSTAEDFESQTELRTAIHFVQRAVNSYQAEVHDTQAASLLLGFSATLTSERSVYFAGWDFVQAACEALVRMQEAGRNRSGGRPGVRARRWCATMVRLRQSRAMNVEGHGDADC